MNDAPCHSPTVAGLTEEQLLARILPLLPAGTGTLIGPGDDAAVIAAPDGRFVVSTDVLVEGRHFRSEWSGGRAIGRRAAAQNLADIAAMGARPTALVVGLVLPGELPVPWVEELACGLAEVAASAGAGVVGGDLSGGDRVMIAVTVHGDLEGREPVLRSGARPGDVLALAGTLGRSAAGLALLTAGAVIVPAAGGVGLVPPALADAITVYLEPRPPLTAGPAAAHAGATAMMDVSDGLLRDAGRLARASGVRIDLDDPAGALAADIAALTPAARELGTDPVDWVLTGGEDHGLLATFPVGITLPEGFRPIGRVLPGDVGDMRGDSPEGAPVCVAGLAPGRFASGWDHFGGQPRR